MKLEPTYNAKKHEPAIYRLWEDSKIFVANPKSPKEHFSVAMPPPNETGTLHIGHALGVTIQDILARHARSKGKDVLWLPGTDHAALPTNAIIEERLRQEGTNKHEIGREEFLRRTVEFVEDSRSTINNQIRAMGASADWSRARYTLSDTLSRCVNEVFVRMYNDGLIYRGYRIVNWDPVLETNVSDDEVEYRPEKTKLYTLKYGPFEITTARPETKFGDKYVVMHPQDKRYLKYREGDQFEAEWLNGKVTATVIKDEAIDPEFGTGVMTITPWHSLVDFEIAERHKLDREQIIGLNGKLLPIAGEYSGFSIEEARPKIVEKLDQKGLLIEVKDNYVHNVALNSRGKGVIEPQIRLQWFIDVNKPAVNWQGKKLSFKEVMQTVIKDNEIELIPSRFDKVYFHWVDNLRDWCISRQIWWGHQIPVWYRKEGGKEETYVGVLPPKDDLKGQWSRDEDTLDTWFSSALWTWSTLIDPELAKNYQLSLNDLLKNSLDFQTYHPTTVLDTAWDILFFWVARMILATTYITGQIPFKTVYLHGLVLTSSGGKMSKSRPDTIINPMDVIENYGTDSLRLALIQGMSAGNSQKLVNSKVITNRNFCNKLWNVARYISGVSDKTTGQPEPKSIADHWILKQLILTKDHINSDLDNYRFSDAYSKLYHFLWDDFADWYIEASKIDPNVELLNYVLNNFLVIAHPLAPFVTEAIWQSIEANRGTILAAQVYQKLMAHNEESALDFESIKLVVSGTRQILRDAGDKDTKMTFKDSSLLDKNRTLIKKLSGAASVEETTAGSGLKLTGIKFNVWLNIDKSRAERHLAKLEEKQKGYKDHLAVLKGRLANEEYVSKAPEEVILDTKMQIEEYERLLSETASEIKLFGSI
jgi:valyl-tRNA synthetase